MNKQTTRVVESASYGRFEVDESQILTFPKGIPGFGDHHDYALIQVENGPFHVLHALDEQLSFIVIPGSFVAENYGFRIDQSVVELLEIQQPEDVMTYVIVNVIDDQPVVNLKAPILINRTTRKGTQYILDDASYPLRHPLALKEGS